MSWESFLIARWVTARVIVGDSYWYYRRPCTKNLSVSNSRSSIRNLTIQLPLRAFTLAHVLQCSGLLTGSFTHAYFALFLKKQNSVFWTGLVQLIRTNAETRLSSTVNVFRTSSGFLFCTFAEIFQSVTKQSLALDASGNISTTTKNIYRDIFLTIFSLNLKATRHPRVSKFQQTLIE